MKCPFCNKIDIGDTPGPTFCPVCTTKFEIDDRSECVFADPKYPRLPINGTICRVCGLVQDDLNPHCLYCGTKLNNKMQ